MVGKGEGERRNVTNQTRIPRVPSVGTMTMPNVSPLLLLIRTLRPTICCGAFAGEPSILAMLDPARVGVCLIASFTACSTFWLMLL